MAILGQGELRGDIANALPLEDRRKVGNFMPLSHVPGPEPGGARP